MRYILTKSGDYNNTGVVLVSDYATNGARYSRDNTLPYTKGKTGLEMTGGEFVRKQLLKPGGDPNLGCDEPDKLIAWAWEFLTKGISPEWVELAELYYELRSKGVKLPAIEIGRNLSDIPFRMLG
jgi:hypothetical protein